MILKLPILLLLLVATRTGADRLGEPEFRQWLEGKRVGLITNQTGVNEQLEQTASILSHIPGVELVALFAPEHGLEGVLQAGAEVASEGKIYSLYAPLRAPSPEVLARLDVLVYDIQDVGSRFYTFTSTLEKSLQAAARAEVSFVVLDRPNPLAGRVITGPVMTGEMASFVGIEGLPIRYGLTVGELALWLVGEQGIAVDLKIVPMESWNRDLWFDQTRLPWVQPSPNMPTLETAILYPGFCLIEGTNLSEGRGTTRPFEWIGAPWLDTARVVAELNSLGLKGVRFRSQSFKPSFSKFQHEQVRGVEIHLRDRSSFEPIVTALAFISTVRKIHPQEFELTKYFDRLVGNRWVREDLQKGLPVASIIAKWQQELEAFRQNRRKYLMY